MKKKLFVGLLIAAMLVSACCFAACSKKETLEIATATPEYTCYVGENVEVYDFITEEDGVAYSFTVLRDGETETTEIKGRTFMPETAGKYNLTVKAVKGKAEAEKSIEFTVYDKLPYVYVSKYGKKYNIDDRYRLNTLINQWNPTVNSGTEFETELDKVTVITGEGEDKEEDVISLSEDSTDGEMFDGKFFTFKKEATYKFNLVVTNAGGSVSCPVTVEAIDDISGFPDLTDNAIEYDLSASNVMSWTAVAGAVNYKVKIGNKTEYTAETEFDITKYLTGDDFQDFDFAVLPIGESGVIGKMVEKIIIAPEGFENVIVKGGTVDKDTSVATLTTVGAPTGSVGYNKNTIRQIDNNYVAFYGEFGAGWSVDFEWTGDDVPQVAFFASDISGNMTDSDGAKGVIGISGFRYDDGSDVLMGPNTCQRFAIIGPNMFTDAYNQGSTDRRYVGIGNVLGLSNIGKTQKYKMTVYAYEKDGDAFVGYKVYTVNGSDTTLVKEFSTMTLGSTEDVKAGHIIAYAPIKGTGTCSFKFSKPYEETSEIVTSQATKNADGSYTVKGSDIIAADANNMKRTLGYVAFKGDYGVGTYVDFYFTGNNRPQVNLFAVPIASNVMDGGGILLMHGGIKADGTALGRYDDRLLGFDATRTNLDNGGNDRFIVENNHRMGAAALKATPDMKYHYQVGTEMNGTKLKVILKLWEVKADETEELLSTVEKSTVNDFDASETGSIVAYAGFNGTDSTTTFSFTAPYTKNA